MALFDADRSPEDDEILGSDAATRALSVTAVENDFVANVYEKLASVYDIVFGPVLHPGRVDAIRRMGIKRGDRVLEVGVGTGINAALYPRDCAVTGIDLSSTQNNRAITFAKGSSITNVNVGVQLSASGTTATTANAALVFGDGEGVIDRASTISATTTVRLATIRREVKV